MDKKDEEKTNKVENKIEEEKEKGGGEE